MLVASRRFHLPLSLSKKGEDVTINKNRQRRVRKREGEYENMRNIYNSRVFSSCLWVECIWVECICNFTISHSEWTSFSPLSSGTSNTYCSQRRQVFHPDFTYILHVIHSLSLSISPCPCDGNLFRSLQINYTIILRAHSTRHLNKIAFRLIYFGIIWKVLRERERWRKRNSVYKWFGMRWGMLCSQRWWNWIAQWNRVERARITTKTIPAFLI